MHPGLNSVSSVWHACAQLPPSSGTHTLSGLRKDVPDAEEVCMIDDRCTVVLWYDVLRWESRTDKLLPVFL